MFSAGHIDSSWLAQTSVSGLEAEAIASQWRQQHFGPQFQMLCHEPAYGLRFYKGARLLFETSVCFKCHNFSTAIFGGGFWGFDAEAPQAAELLKQLEQLLPSANSIETRSTEP